MSYSSRRVLTPKASRKRKEMEAIHFSTVSNSLTAFSPAVGVPNQAATMTPSPKADQQPLSSNRLLAGYMAFEFLSKGTLLGQKFESGRSDPKKNPPGQASAEEGDSTGKLKPQCYVNVASLLRSEDGAHIPGVVNPTHLARWIQM